MEATTYAEAVGAFLRGFRSQHGLTLEAIARTGRDYGATWSLSSVQAIEAGKASPTLPTLLTLALVLGTLSGHPLKLIDLLGSAEVFDRPFSGQPERPVHRTLVERALSGQYVQLDANDVPLSIRTDAEPLDLEAESSIARNLPFGADRNAEAGEHDDPSLSAYEVDSELEAALLRRDGPLTAEERRAAFEQTLEQSQMPPEPACEETETAAFSQSTDKPTDVPPTLAEKRAAKALEISARELQRRAQRLWGRSLEDESARRAGPRSSPQARGRVTRVLVSEVRASIANGR